MPISNLTKGLVLLAAFALGSLGTLAAAPPVPRGVTASQGLYADRICLNWQAATGALGYEVWRGELAFPAFANKISPTNQSDTTFCDSAVTTNLAYYYWVKVVNADGASAFSDAVAGFSALAMTSGTVKFINESRRFAAPIFGVETGEVAVAKFGNDASGNPPDNQTYTGGALSGDYAAQLWGGPQGTPEPRLLPVPESLLLFQTNVQAGYFRAASAVAVPGVAPGGLASLQVRVWDRRGGAVDTWAKAVADPSVAKGASLVFVSQPLANPATLAPEPTGLRSFNLCLGTPPAFTVVPTNQAVLAGANLILQAQAAGSGTLNYQWQRNGVSLAGASTAALALNGVTVPQSGSYRVVASSWYGEAAAGADLSVFNLPLPPANHVALPLRFEGGVVAVQFAGVSGQTCRLLRSADLRNWVPVATNSVTDLGAAQLLDSAPLSGSAFYQVATP